MNSSLSRARRVAGFAAALTLMASSLALAAGPSASFVVGGAVQHPATYGLADLQALPALTQSVAFGSGSGAQSHTYTGASLWGVVDTAGFQTGANKNDVLSKYVVATGSDGYRVAFSAGELNPAFGNRPDLIAYAETTGGVSAPLAADGFARITAPGDAKGGRYVSNLTRLDVGGSAPYAAGPGGASTTFRIGGDVVHAGSFDLAALKALPSITRTVGTTSYTGVSFWDLLNSTAGLATHAGVKNDQLGMMVVATGSDGYRVAFSLGELDPAFGNQPDLIAYEADGAPLGASAGFARIVVPNDGKAGRYVSNLVSLDVFHAVAPVPEPATMGLMLIGLAGLGWKLRRARPGSRSRP